MAKNDTKHRKIRLGLPSISQLKGEKKRAIGEDSANHLAEKASVEPKVKYVLRGIFPHIDTNIGKSVARRCEHHTR